MIPPDELHEYMESPVTSSSVIAQDETLFRISHAQLTEINGRPDNLAMLYDYYGICWWFSIVNGRCQELADTVAGNEMNWRSWGVLNNPLYEAFCGVKYYLCREDDWTDYTEEAQVDELWFNNEHWYVYQNPYYFGMAYMRDQAQSATLWENKESLWSYDDNIYRTYIVRQSEIPVAYDKSGDRIILTVDAASYDELVVLIPYDNNWHAYVDGVETELRNTDIAYMAMSMTPGTHEVVLQYVPREFYIGCVMMGVGLTGVIILQVLRRRPTRRAECSASLSL